MKQTTFLEEILQIKKKRVKAAKQSKDTPDWREKVCELRRSAEPRRLEKALRNFDRLNIIAEIKRASPSKGVINDKIDVAEIAKSYQTSGASAISVLTEEDFFRGSLDDLKIVRQTVDLPILRKDFFYDEFQIFEAAEAGADVILLIAAMLENEVLPKLYSLAANLGLDVLVEVHTLEELERAQKIGARIIGVNNRDLRSFNVTLDVSRELIKHAPGDALLITESGLSTKEEILELKELGFAGFLIGEALMRSGNAGQELRKLAMNEHEIKLKVS